MDVPLFPPAYFWLTAACYRCAAIEIDTAFFWLDFYFQ
jgi:hypothetical protein